MLAGPGVADSSLRVSRGPACEFVVYTFVLILHLILSTFLILIVLMQPGKGADISSAFGGGSASQLFGASGPGNFLTRGTGAIAAGFMCTSIVLALYSTETTNAGSITDDMDKVEGEGEEGAGFGNKAPAAPVDAGEGAGGDATGDAAGDAVETTDEAPAAPVPSAPGGEPSTPSVPPQSP